MVEGKWGAVHKYLEGMSSPCRHVCICRHEQWEEVEEEEDDLLPMGEFKVQGEDDTMWVGQVRGSWKSEDVTVLKSALPSLMDACDAYMARGGCYRLVVGLRFIGFIMPVVLPRFEFLIVVQ
eukprot:TRINITY_DN13486_c0_g1_i2.p1 TRINITY_DN13486_c0_g1~~TRINITY_DN13486_c0_g1_i2.p1  ORF type:complete len:129 (-),score=20.32 TRINITY_DN13486_c0_g1_i2:139-504(-)